MPNDRGARRPDRTRPDRWYQWLGNPDTARGAWPGGVSDDAELMPPLDPSYELIAGDDLALSDLKSGLTLVQAVLSQDELELTSETSFMDLVLGLTSASLLDLPATLSGLTLVLDSFESSDDLALEEADSRFGLLLELESGDGLALADERSRFGLLLDLESASEAVDLTSAVLLGLTVGLGVLSDTLALTTLGSALELSPRKFLAYGADSLPKDYRIRASDVEGLTASSSTVVGFVAVNEAGFTIQAGQPVRLHADGTLRLAQADSIAHAAVGVAAEQVANGGSVQVVRVGTVSRDDWTVVAGAASLTPNSRYALVQGSPGLIADSWPGGAGDVQQQCGLAVSAQVLLVDVTEPIPL